MTTHRTPDICRLHADERERIAQAIETERRANAESGFPAAWFAAMDLCARIARMEPDADPQAAWSAASACHSCGGCRWCVGYHRAGELLDVEGAS
jgi:hypothetical protein